MVTSSPRHAVVRPEECVACGTCMDVCPQEAIKICHGSYAVVNEERCVGCGICSRECPASIIRIEVR